MTKARDLANLISGGLTANEIPDLPASKITSGTLASARLSLSASDIPNLDTAKITSGTFADARLASSNVTQHVDLSSLNASNLTSGTVPSARLSLSASDVPDLATSKITSGTFADARLSSSSVTQHVDLSNLNASNLTSGSIPNARVPSGAVTQHVSAVTQATGTWTPSPNFGGINTIYANYARTGNIVTCVAGFKFDGSGRSNTSTSFYQMSGLPITPRSSGASVVVGGGSYNFYKSEGKQGIIKVSPGDTTFRFYGHGASLTTTVKYTSGGADTLSFMLGSQGDSGYRMILKNMYQTMDNNRYGHIFLVYQV